MEFVRGLIGPYAPEVKKWAVRVAVVAGVVAFAASVVIGDLPELEDGEDEEGGES